MKEWYLIGNNTKPNMLGGYENQAFLDYKDDAFLESLKTDIATTVILYNYDLSESKEIRCIIQGNTADTYLNLMGRTILAPIGTFKAGNYVFFENEYWLVNGRPGNNKIYEKVTVVECQYLLRWQNANGNIIERWINLTSASKYDVGETGNSTITLSSDNFTILIPNDDESFDIDGKRVFIDLHPTNPTKVFKITRTDDALFYYGKQGGILSLIADKTELNLEKDNQELRICDYIDISAPPLPPSPSNPNETTDLSAVISTKTGEIILKNGFSRIYTVNFTDKIGNEVNYNDVDFSWNMVADFDIGLITQLVSENTIKLSIDDEDLIGSSFLLSVIVDSNVVAQVTINIVEGF